ncbi:hypothetical protein V1460_30420 [Streptomyces sp. SCSIO 30461]|uniref:hypothetical protein n=1 Tax=Streptomyces sp. SCSIO 30461 TaxID=3118085 RepID=UPI0030CDD932
MTFDIQRQPMPRDDTLRLISAINAMKNKARNAAEQWELLDERGHVPAEPSYAGLLQHAVGAQDLSRAVIRLTANFATSPHSKTRDGRTVLARLATASTMSSHASGHFAETAETILALSRSPEQSRPYLENSMVLDHATARAYLRRTSESLRDAVKELDAHLDFHRYFSTPSRQERPAPAPPRGIPPTPPSPPAGPTGGR